MPRHSYVTVVGECVADAFVDDEAASPDGPALRIAPGGGPADTAVALARLGTPTRFAGRLSLDVFGSLLRSHPEASGVDLDGCVLAEEPSTLTVSRVDDHGQAQHSFRAERTADRRWSTTELDHIETDAMAAVHTGSLALVREPEAEATEEFLTRVRRSATASIDPNVHALLVDMHEHRARLSRWCALTDILRISADDLAHMYPELSVVQACDAWHRAGVPLVVVTLGARGTVVSLDGARAKVPGRNVDVVDTIGAGYAFTAGLLQPVPRRRAARRPTGRAGPGGGSRGRHLCRPGGGTDLHGQRGQRTLGRPTSTPWRPSGVI
ncbi:carbohydrate kinase family protein [Streptomyces sp. NBC_00243]|uniref:carbohydrate kinase family protein n=1 Tax=Streptomyces sp. NBC_00243 TaxID=2975688 RepID=UPI002DD8EA07|nr:carbohydrate kinase [Streptomyces sp. NBC_00243]